MASKSMACEKGDREKGGRRARRQRVVLNVVYGFEDIVWWGGARSCECLVCMESVVVGGWTLCVCFAFIRCL